MRRLVLICLMLLSPALAMQDASSPQKQDRLLEGAQKIWALEEQAKTFIHWEEDTFSLEKEKIHNQRSCLPTGNCFEREMDPLLEILLPPEDLLSEEQRRGLLTYPPNLENLQPLDRVIGLLERFTIKWLALAAYAEKLQSVANVSLESQMASAAFVTRLEKQLKLDSTGQNLSHEELGNIYTSVQWFHQEQAAFLAALEKLQLELQRAEIHLSILGKDFSYLEPMVNELGLYFEARGAILWELIRNLIAVKDPELFQGLPLTYQAIPKGYFADNRNPLKGALLNNTQKGRVLLLQEEGESAILFDPLDGQFVKKLTDSFAQSDQWGAKIKAFEEKSQLLYMTKSLTILLEKYREFRNRYFRQISNAYDILTPKTQFRCLCEPHPGRVAQTMACKVSCIEHNGWFCFNKKNKRGQFEAAAQLKGKGNQLSYDDGNITFTTRDTKHPFQIGRDRLLYWLESLLDIESDPTTFGIFDHILYLEPDTPQTIAESGLVKKYLENPKNWHKQSRFSFVRIEQNPKGGFLRDILEDIAGGRNSFECLDVDSFGRQMLASILLKRPMTLENSGVEEINGKLVLKRVGPGEIFHPSFHLLEEGQHRFVGANILFLLPFADRKISQKVKEGYLSNNIVTILCHFLTKAKDLERCFNDICLHYKLSANDELEDLLDTKVSQARALGLVALTRPGLVNHLLEIDAKIRNLLLTRKSITPLELLEAVYPEDFQCYQGLEEAGRRETKEEAFRVLLDDIIPFKIDQLKDSQTREYSLEDLKAFESSRSACRLTYNIEVSEGRPFLFDKVVSEIKDSKAQKFIQECYVELFQWALEKKTMVTFFGEVLPSIINAFREAYSIARRRGEKPPYDFKALEEQAQACLDRAKANEATSFQELLSAVSSTTAAAFFKEKYEWWKVENSGDRARCILDTWEVASGEHKVTYENLIPETVSSLPLWEKIPMRTGMEYTAPTFSNLLESNNPVDSMINDFIQRVDLSSLPWNTVMATDFGFGLPLSEIVLKRGSWPIALTKKHVSDYLCLRQHLPSDISTYCMWLNCRGNTLVVSGTRGNTALLCRLISLFPDTTSLSIRDNGLRSLKPLVTTLGGLPNLTGLHISENPIHNPGPLGAFPNLCTLIMENTCIPALELPALKHLISPGAKTPPLNNVTEYVNNHTIGDYEVRQRFLRDNYNATLRWHMESYMVTDNLTPNKTDTMICILEWLSSEKNWNETLKDYCTQSRSSSFKGLPWDRLFDLFEQQYDPIDLARKLIFSLKFGFPAGTLPFKLSFVNNLPTKKADSLTCLAISNVSVEKKLLSSLTQFGNLTHLYLCGTENSSLLKDLPPLGIIFLDLTNNGISSLKGLHTDREEIKFSFLQILILKYNCLTNKSEACLRFLEELPLIALNLSNNKLTEEPKLGTIQGLSPLNPRARLDLRENNIEAIHKRINGTYFKYSPQSTPQNSPQSTRQSSPQRDQKKGEQKKDKK